jgi:hypothetical protein
MEAYLTRINKLLWMQFMSFGGIAILIAVLALGLWYTMYKFKYILTVYFSLEHINTCILCYGGLFTGVGILQFSFTGA